MRLSREELLKQYSYWNDKKCQKITFFVPTWKILYPTNVDFKPFVRVLKSKLMRERELTNSV